MSAILYLTHVFSNLVPIYRGSVFVVIIMCYLGNGLKNSKYTSILVFNILFMSQRRTKIAVMNPWNIYCCKRIAFWCLYVWNILFFLQMPYLFLSQSMANTRTIKVIFTNIKWDNAIVSLFITKCVKIIIYFSKTTAIHTFFALMALAEKKIKK